MKKVFVISVLLSLLCLSSCTNDSGKKGEPFAELPLVEADSIWEFLQAIPGDVFPDELKSVEARKAYRSNYEYLTDDGILGDGEGFTDISESSDNFVYWSDYFSKPEDYEWTDEDNEKPHPFVRFNVYHGVEENELYGIFTHGEYVDDGEKIINNTCYWYDTASGKLTPAKLNLNPPYTTDDLTEDTLLMYGSDELYFAIKNGRYGPNYYDRGFTVYINDVGITDVQYEWNGVEFVRETENLIPCIYNFGFSHISIGDDITYSIPGYTTERVSDENPFDRIYSVTKKGENDPTLLFHVGDDYKISEIVVCKGRYCNPYGIYPGMPMDAFMLRVGNINNRFDDTPYVSIVDQGDGFVNIYTGFDEDFVYSVPAGDYLGDERFAPDAKLARVTVINAVG